MRKLIFITLVAVMCSCIATAHTKETVSSNNRLPVESIFYSAMFDTVCATKTNFKINPNWVNELKQRLPTWKTLWNKEGTLLLKTTTQLISRPFAQQNFQVAVSLCSFPSMSAPLIVNARYTLKSFTDHTISDDVFISNIYHEILHNYLDYFLPRNTPLLEKYKNESKGVLNHLHLLALEKAVYLQLGWESKLNDIIEKDGILPNKDYKRAWEILNKNDNYKNFITELKKFNSSKVVYPNEI